MDSFTLNKIEFDAIRGILSQFCSCSLGKSLANRISPSRNPEVIRHWLAQVGQMIAAVRDVGLPPLAGVTDITAALQRATPGAGAGGEDFAAIGGVLEAAANVKRYFEALPESLPLLRELAGGLFSFDSEIAAIQAVVETDGSIRDSASPKLAELRQEIAQTGQRIRDIMYGYLRQEEVAKLLQNVAVTLHGDRFVLPVKAEYRGRLAGVIHRASNTGATVFIEPEASVELNNRLADLYMDERREIERLLHTLSVRLSPRLADIAAALRNLAQIDLLSAKAQYAYQFDMNCPEVTENGPLQLHQARHPLLIDQAWRQEKSGVPPEHRLAVVPIDVRLGSDFDLLVITGSNTGGKTVALKTVAMLALMAQTGLHIPSSRGSTLPVFRDIFIDVGDEQSLQQSLSTFGAHIKRIKYILHKADKASLVLLDELGAGTDPEEGGAIGQAILDELRRLGCLGMITTHLGVLKAYAFNHERVDNASVEFNTETLRPTYHLLIGTPGESHALAVAHHLGLPKRLVAAAKKYVTDQGKEFRRAIQATSLVRQDAEEARAEAHAAQIEAQSRQETFEAKLADLHRLQQQFETWLASLGELKPGDQMFVPSLNRPGTLVRLELHRQIAVVDSGSMQVEVPLKELMPDLGQEAVRKDIDALRQQILQQASQTQQAQAEARRIQEEYHKSLLQHKERARQFDTWLGAIARVKVGDEVPIARKPGKAKVVKFDLPGLRATVATEEGEIELSIQDLFPQTGPFAHLPSHPERRPEPHGRPPQQRRPDHRPRPAEGHKPGPPRDHAGPPRHEEPQGPPQPIVHRNPDSEAAKRSREILLATEPGKPVYIVPFQKRATLIRINADKGQAVVQSGIFELQIPLADLEPIKP